MSLHTSAAEKENKKGLKRWLAKLWRRVKRVMLRRRADESSTYIYSGSDNGMQHVPGNTTRETPPAE